MLFFNALSKLSEAAITTQHFLQVHLRHVNSTAGNILSRVGLFLSTNCSVCWIQSPSGGRLEPISRRVQSLVQLI